MIAEKQKIKKSFQINNLLFFVVALLPFLITSSFSFASSNKPLLFLGDKDYPPYEWLEEGTPTGLNVDICREISRVIGREIKVELMQWKTAQEKVLKGEADGLIEIDISEERRKLYDLTETTIEFSYSLFVRSDNVVISEVSDVEGKKVGVTAGGYPRRVLAKNPKIDLIFVKNYLEGFEYLKSGKIDALGADTWVAPYLIQKHGIKGITVTGDPFFKIKGAFAVKKGNTKLLNEIDAGVKKLIKDGTLDRLKKKWSRKEIIFLTQEKLQRIYIIVTILFLGILSGLLLLWIFTLKKQIRKRDKAEAELQQAHDNLEQRVKERTFDLEKVNKALQSEITERKQAEEKLRLHAAMMDNVTEGVYLIGLDDLLIKWTNEKFARMFGYDLGEMVGMNVDIVNAPTERTPTETRISIVDVLKETGEWHGEIRNIKRDGTHFWCYANVSLFEHPEYGKVIVSVHTDITEQKRAEEEREKLQEQLLQSRKMEAIGSLAGGIAHEFNNILTTIIGNTELAIGDIPERSPARKCLEEIQSASARAKDVVRQILGFARKSVFQLMAVEISPLVSETLKLIRASIPTTIEIRQNISCESDTVMADSSQFSQLLINLCTNAKNAMQEKGGVLEVKLENTTLDEKSATHYEDLSPGNYVKLTVRDTGTGIDPTIVDRIFDPYFTTTSLAEGTGMGLAVVLGIVKHHNGAITVASEPGKGTVFEVLFPLTEAEEEQKSEKSEVLPAGAERILFVDDEVSLVKMAKQRLEMQGYQVESKSDPVEALELFRYKPDRFDLIITDMTMPKMTGDKLAKEILSIRPDMPIILCSGFSEKIDAEKAQALGIRKYIEKPLDMSDFLVSIRKILDEAKSSSTHA